MTFYIINKNSSQFGNTETLAMLIAALCHDVDHAGYTNMFYGMTESSLAKLYSAATHQNYSYYITMLLFQKTNIWLTYDNKKFRTLRNNIQNLMLACDKANGMETLIKVKRLTINKPLDPNITEEREVIKSLVLMVSDMSIFLKPFSVCFDDVIGMFEELFAEGDLYKEINKVPPEMMDRNNWASIPKFVAELIEDHVLPSLFPLQESLANTDSLYESFQHTAGIWKITTLQKIGNNITFIEERLGLFQETDDQDQENDEEEEQEEENDKEKDEEEKKRESEQVPKNVDDDEEEDNTRQKEEQEIEVDDEQIQKEMNDE